MAVPNMTPTPQATVTVSEGYNTTAASEFWQRVAGGVYIVYGGVPQALMQNVLQSADPDTAIRLQLAGYPRRVASS
jgi:hypothetical protein